MTMNPSTKIKIIQVEPKFFFEKSTLKRTLFRILCCIDMSCPEDTHDEESLWRYQEDPTTTLCQTVSTKDLISWAFQVARGMSYLASKKVSLSFFLSTTKCFSHQKRNKVFIFALGTPWRFSSAQRIAGRRRRSESGRFRNGS